MKWETSQHTSTKNNGRDCNEDWNRYRFQWKKIDGSEYNRERILGKYRTEMTILHNFSGDCTSVAGALGSAFTDDKKLVKSEILKKNSGPRCKYNKKQGWSGLGRDST